MRLDEFIQDALFQIANGVIEANKKLTCVENPKSNIPFLIQRDNDSERNTGISFDIAVTTSHELKTSANGKASIFIADAKLDANGTYEREQTSRIKFTVGVDSRIGYALDKLSQKKDD